MISEVFSRGCRVGVWQMLSRAGERGTGYHRKIIRQKDIVPVPPLHFFYSTSTVWRGARFLQEKMEFILEKSKKDHIMLTGVFQPKIFLE